MQVQISTKVSVEVFQWLDYFAKNSGQSKASIIETSILDYKEKIKQQSLARLAQKVKEEE